jgi:hypothetical protein
MMTHPVLAPTLRRIALPLLGIAVLCLVTEPAMAQYKGTTRNNVGGGGGNFANKGNVNNRVNVNNRANIDNRVNVNNRTNVNNRVNVNQNRNVNVNVNGGGGYYGPSYGPSYNRGANVAGAVAATILTAAVIGSVVNTLPPSCSTVYANGLAYQNCGGTYYQQQYQGSSVNYVVVNQP